MATWRKGEHPGKPTVHQAASALTGRWIAVYRGLYAARTELQNLRRLIREHNERCIAENEYPAKVDTADLPEW